MILNTYWESSTSNLGKGCYLITKLIDTWLHADFTLHPGGQTHTPEDKRPTPEDRRSTPEDRGRTPEDSAHPGGQRTPGLQRVSE